MSAKNLFSRKELALILCLALVQFCHIVDFMILMPLGPTLMRTLNISPQIFSYLVSGYTFSAGLSTLFAAFFIDRFDRKDSLIFCFSGFCLGTLACGMAQSYQTLLCARIFTGAFGGVMTSIVFSIIGDSFDFNRRGSAMGLVMGSFSIASIVGVPISLLLAQAYRWEAPFLVLALLGLLELALMMKVIPKMHAHVNNKEKQTSHLLSILKTPSLGMGLVFMMFLIMSQFSVIPFLSPSLVANADLKESQLPFLYLFGGIGSMLASPLIGRAADKFGKKRVFQIATLVSLIPFYLVTHLEPQPVILLLVVTSFFFVTMTGRVVSAQAMITSLTNPKIRGSFMSLSASVTQFSSAIASFTAGLIIVKSADGRLLNFGLIGIISIIFSVFALVMSSKLYSSEGKL